MTFQDFIDQNGISATSTLVDSNPNMSGDDRGMTHHKVTLRRTVPAGNGFPRSTTQFSVIFSQGSGHRGKDPQAKDVLCCLASDASYVDESFEDFCSSLGYDTDSRKAERTFKVTQTTTKRLRKFLGDTLFAALRDCEE